MENSFDRTCVGVVGADNTLCTAYRPTAKLRFFNGKLQQEWSADTSNGPTTDWRDVQHIEEPLMAMESGPISKDAVSETDIDLNAEQYLLSADQYRKLYALAKRTLWTAYVWNDHNFEHPHKITRETCATADIKTFNEANEFLTNLP